MSPRLRLRTRARVLARALIGLLAVLALFSPPTTAHADPGENKIAAAVRTDLKDGKATFFVHLKGEANLAAARTAKTKESKAKAVYEAKSAYAARSQAGLRALLTGRKAAFTPFWLVNTVKVTADASLAKEIAALPEVTAIEPIGKIERPEPKAGKAKAKTGAKAAAAVEWGVDRINAPRVWNELNNRGEGITVAIIDTGVDFEHPAIDVQYRGRKPDGSVDHNYNWFDTARGCPTPVPCGSEDHGTHVTGTIVGENGIGVAPGAKWIAVNGCCDSDALVAAGQWLITPTDLNGQNIRYDLVPDVVNNSWGKNEDANWYRTIIQGWIAAGIFPMFSAGNGGNGLCDSVGKPAHYTESYAAQSFDIEGMLQQGGVMGPGENGEIKPDISAPGVDIRSSTPYGEYKVMTGTSMAAPHVAGAVALLWSAAPSLRGDIAATRQVLDGTAVDMSDETCGGTPSNNNTFGEGALDVYAAVQAAPDDALGDLRGTVTVNGQPLSGAEVRITGQRGRTTGTDQSGAYALSRVPPGQYQVTASRFGHQSATGTVTVTDGQTTTGNLALTRLPHSAVSGTVTVGGAADAGATVTVSGTPVKAVTDASGRYRIDLPHGSHRLEITASSPCIDGATAQISVSGDLTKDIALERRHDTFGYTCEVGAEPYVAGTTESNVGRMALPFPVPFYGESYSQIWITGNGVASFTDHPDGEDSPLPSPSAPNAAVYPFWDGLNLDGNSSLHTGTVGTAPHRSFVIEWRNVRLDKEPPDDDDRLSVSALLGEDGTIGFRYKEIDGTGDHGPSATVGIENADGTDALQYSHISPSLKDGMSLTFTAGAHGAVRGMVTDANDGRPLAGAKVEFPHVATFTTGEDGTYGGLVRAGSHQVKVSKQLYGTHTRTINVAPGTVTTDGAALITGKVTATPTSLSLAAPPGATTTATLTLTNGGTAPSPYEVTTEPALLTAAPASGGLLQNQSATVTVTASTAGLAPGDTRTGKVVVQSASGRQPVIEIPVTLTVSSNATG
ncbi:S8 family serine peptidase [Spongiactinospora sp. TRM90649]|uniref:S8 family serine peptidase n=1 Tax=Spongiactinospora sp. TRM90649 TaxID=3031114 RepID=UPI0023F89A03|nr:S8 family serine peptidase [Spongiactinospora sp. TRM90649]MDF5754729.1 S8 family serine peptidase [Spongiactinospora sp. TRM90649]